MLKTAPAVFAVGDSYHIMAPVACEALYWVRIGDQEFYDESNGILRSLSELHRAVVPMALLDSARKYTVCIRPLIERKPYFSQTAPVEEYSYDFSPVPEDAVRAYQIADAHNTVDEPVAAALAFGPIDLLILNGDVIDNSGDPSKFINIYEICSRITGGSKPTIFSRGNHDMRGLYAEKFAEYTPNSLGNTYYSFRLGSIWGVMLDCGEDKTDDHAEYGYTVYCRNFRRRQTQYLRSLIERAGSEYAAEGVTHRLVIAHNPFTCIHEAPFDIEQDTYREWTALLREHIRPDLLICGHMHQLDVWMPGGRHDHQGQPCPVVVGSLPRPGYFAGCGFIFHSKGTHVVFNDSTGAILAEYDL